MSTPPANSPASADNGPTPDVQLLKKLLEGDLTPAEQIEVMGLIESQPAWQKAIEKLTAGMRSWQQVAEHLREPPVPVDARLREILARFDTANGNAIDVEKPRPRAGTGLEFLNPAGDGQHLGQLREYQIQEILGQGGMGMVLKAFDPPLHRVVALKVMNPQLATVAAARRRFVREAQAAAAVVHENVVTIHGVDESGPLPMIVMACVPGQSLQERIDDVGPLQLREILRIGLQTASGLAAAHAQGLVHRDVKPANILLENGVQRVKLTDFGLARAVDDASMTMTGVVSGTPQFMSPEQARGDEIDFRTDLFSLGSVMYAMCTGRAPFRASTVMGVLRRVCEEPARPIRELNPEVPVWLAAVINKLMSKVRTERYQTASEVATVLEQCLAHNQRPELMPLPEAVLDLVRDEQDASEQPQATPVAAFMPARAKSTDDVAGKPQIGKSPGGKSPASKRSYLPGPGMSNSILFMIGAGLEVAAVLTLLSAPHPANRLPIGGVSMIVPMIMFCGMVLGLWNFLFRRVTWSGVSAGGWVLITKIAAVTALSFWDFATTTSGDHQVTFILWLNIIAAGVVWSAAELLRKMALYSPWLPVGAGLVMVPLTCIMTVPLTVISSYQRANILQMHARMQAEQAAQLAVAERMRAAQELAAAQQGGDAQVTLTKPLDLTVVFRNLQTKQEKKIDGSDGKNDAEMPMSLQFALPAGEYLVMGFKSDGGDESGRKLIYSRAIHLVAHQQHEMTVVENPVLQRLQARWKPLTASQNGAEIPLGQAPWLTFHGDSAILSLNDKKSSTYQCRWSLGAADQPAAGIGGMPGLGMAVPAAGGPMSGMPGMGMGGGGFAEAPGNSSFDLFDLDGRLKFRGDFVLMGEAMTVTLTAMNGEVPATASPQGMATPAAMAPMPPAMGSGMMMGGFGSGPVPAGTTLALLMVVEGSPLDRIQGEFDLVEESGEFPLEVGAAGNFEHKAWLVQGTRVTVSYAVPFDLGALENNLRTLDARDELGRAIRGVLEATPEGLVIQFGVPDGRRPDNTEPKEGEYHARIARRVPPEAAPNIPRAIPQEQPAGYSFEETYLFKLRGDIKLTVKDLTDGKEFSYPASVEDPQEGKSKVLERKLSLPRREFLVTGSVGDRVLISSSLNFQVIDFSMGFLAKLRGEWIRTSAELKGGTLPANQLTSVRFDENTVVLSNLIPVAQNGGAADQPAATPPPVLAEFRVEWEHRQYLEGRLFDKEDKLVYRIALKWQQDNLDLLLIPAAETVPDDLSTSPFSERILLKMKKARTEPKPDEAQPEPAVPAKPNPEEATPEEPKPAEAKTQEPKPQEPKVEAPKPAEPIPEQSNAVEPKSDPDAAEPSAPKP